MAYKYTGSDLRARHALACVTFEEERHEVWTVESELQARVIELLEIYTRVINREAAATRRGVSDITCCIGGRFVAIELKDDKGTPSPQQLRYLEKVEESGGIGGVCRTIGDVLDLLEKAIYP